MLYLKLSRYSIFLIFWVISCQIPQQTVTKKSVFNTLPPKSVLEKLLERNNYLIDFKAFARTTISREESTQILKQVFLVKNSRFVRIDTLSSFGQLIGVFIHSPHRTLIYDPGQDRIFRGSDAWQTVERVIGTTVDFDETLSLFSGSIPQLKNLKLQSVQLKSNKNSYQLKLQHPSNLAGFEIVVDATHLGPTILEKWFGQKLIYKAQWEDYKNIDGFYFAHRITLSRFYPEETLIVTYRKPKINPGIPMSAFELPMKNS